MDLEDYAKTINLGFPLDIFIYCDGERVLVYDLIALWHREAECRDTP